MTARSKRYAATATRTAVVRRRNAVRSRRPTPPSGGYGPIFFIVLGVTIASAVGFLGVVASVLAGN
jgi:hypothetical protein